ncbi:MAG: alpha/beta hydrolase [Burkholderiaceae bacterium]
MSEPTLHTLSCPDIDGTHRMAYWQWGDPENDHVVLCVHGLTRQGRDFDELAQDLCTEFRVICPDVVGRGQSEWLKTPQSYQITQYASDIRLLLKQLQPSTLDWVGTSMGGLIAMVLCGADEPLLPVAVRRLVLNDVGPTMQWQALQRIGSSLGQSSRFDSVQQAAGALWQTSSSFGPHSPAQWLALSRPMVKPVGDGTAALTLNYDPAIALPFHAITPESAARSEASLWHFYDNISAETLLIHGAESDFLSSATALEMTRRGPKAQLVEFGGVGHAPTLVSAQQRQVIKSFLLAPQDIRAVA